MRIGRDEHLLKLNSNPVRFPHFALYERQGHEILPYPRKRRSQEDFHLVETPEAGIQKLQNPHQ